MHGFSGKKSKLGTVLLVTFPVSPLEWRRGDSLVSAVLCKERADSPEQAAVGLAGRGRESKVGSH